MRHAVIKAVAILGIISDIYDDLMPFMKPQYFFICVLTLLSCAKDEVLEHKNLNVNGNVPPPYDGVPTLLVENYVSKIHIDLTGLKADEEDRDEAVTYLEENKLSSQSRVKVILDVMLLDSYHDRLFQLISQTMLNGMGYDEVQGVHTEYTYVRDLLYQSGDTFTAQYIDNELIKLGLVLDAPAEYKAGNISLNEYFRRFAYNLIYDEINMGSENFVKSCFENFFRRNPTADELQNGVQMVDGQPVKILLQAGNNKADFLEILTGNREFYQGRVLDSYLNLLLRKPESSELSGLTEDFITSHDFRDVQAELIKSDEYAGFE